MGKTPELGCCGTASNEALFHSHVGCIVAMAEGKMIRGSTILAFAAGFIAFGNARVTVLSATDPAAVSPTESTISRGIGSAEPGSVGAASPVARERPLERLLLRGNPLWAVPLRSLPVTRERPIFSQSRRPAAPALVAMPFVRPEQPPPPKPAEPDHPLLALVGTVVGETERIGIFFDQSAKDVIRLRTGEGYSGWILRSVRGREATFEKDRQTAILALPLPGAEQPGQPPAASANGARPGNTWMDGDGQLIRPPPSMRRD
jgi:general secretion pathway protein N